MNVAAKARCLRRLNIKIMIKAPSAVNLNKAKCLTWRTVTVIVSLVVYIKFQHGVLYVAFGALKCASVIH